MNERIPSMIAMAIAIGLAGGCGGGGGGSQGVAPTSQVPLIAVVPPTVQPAIPSDNGAYAPGSPIDTTPQPDGGSYALDLGPESAYADVRILLPDGSRVLTTTALAATVDGTFLLADKARRQLVAKGWTTVFIIGNDGVRERVWRLSGDLTGAPDGAFARVAERWSWGRTPETGVARGEVASSVAPTLGPVGSVTERDDRLEQAKAKLAEIQARLDSAKSALAGAVTSRDALKASVQSLLTKITELGGKAASLEELKRRLAALPWATGDEDALRISVQSILDAYRRGDYGVAPAAASILARAATAADPTPAIQARIDQLSTQLALLGQQLATKQAAVDQAQAAYDRANAEYLEWAGNFAPFAASYRDQALQVNAIISDFLAAGYPDGSPGYTTLPTLAQIKTVGDLNLAYSNARDGVATAASDEARVRAINVSRPADDTLDTTTNGQLPGGTSSGEFPFMAGSIAWTITYSQDAGRDYPATVTAIVTAYGQTSQTISCPVTAKSRIHGARLLRNWIEDPVGRNGVRLYALMRLGATCAGAKASVEGMQKWWDYQLKEGIVRDRKAALDALIAAKAALEKARDKYAQCKAQLDSAKAELAAAKAQDWQGQLDKAAADKAAEQARLDAAILAVTAAQNVVTSTQIEFDGQSLIITQIQAGGTGAVVARTRTADVHGRSFPVTYRTNSGESAAQMDAKLDALVAKIQQDVLVNRIDYADGYVEQYAWYADAATRNYPVLVWGKWSRGGRTFGTGNVYKCSNEAEKERVKTAIAAEAAAVKTTEAAPNWKEIEGGLFVRHYRKYGADGLAECWTLVNSGTGREASNAVVVGRTGRLDARGVHDAEAAAEAAALGWGRTPVSYNGGTYRLFDLPDGRHFAKYQVAAGGRWWTTPTTWAAATAIESECRAIIDRYVANLASAQAQQAATISVEMRATIEDQSTLGRGMVIVSQQDLQARFNALRTAYAQYQKSDPNAPDTGPGSTAPMPVAVVAPVTQIDWDKPVADAPVPDELSQGWAAHFRDLFEAGWADLRSECPELGIAEGVKDAVENKVQEYMVLLNMDYAGAYAAVKGGIREIYGLATDSAKREQFKNDIVADLEGLADTTPLILAAFANIGDEAQRFWSVTPQADRYRLASGFIAGIALEFYDPAKKLTFVKYLDRVAPMAARSPATMRSALSKGRLLASCPIAYRVVKSALCIRKFISAGRSMNVRTVAEAYRSIERAEARALEAIDDLRSIGLSKKGAKHIKAIMDSGFKDAGEFGKLRETDTILIEKLCAKDAKLGVVNPKKIQEHHFLSNKHGNYEEEFLAITRRYGINDLDDWQLNKAFVTDHVGNHTRNDAAYHEWMLNAIAEIHKSANGDRARFESGFSKIASAIAQNSESALAGDMSKLPIITDILK